jgi:IS4 transposase
MFFKNIKLFLCEKKKNKNEDNLVIIIIFNHWYIINIQINAELRGKLTFIIKKN